MINFKSIQSIFTLGILAFFLILEVHSYVDLVHRTDDTTPIEMGESLSEWSETDIAEDVFVDFGGCGFWQKVRHDLHQTRIRFRQLWHASFQCGSHSLVILYCCLKVAFC